MDPMTMALIASTGLGFLKSAQDQENYKDNMKVQAVKERWSPFTGRAGEMSQRPSGMNTMMQALLTGAQMGQQFGGKSGATDTSVAANQDSPEAMRMKLRASLGEPGRAY